MLETRALSVPVIKHQVALELLGITSLCHGQQECVEADGDAGSGPDSCVHSAQESKRLQGLEEIGEPRERMGCWRTHTRLLERNLNSEA